MQICSHPFSGRSQLQLWGPPLESAGEAAGTLLDEGSREAPRPAACWTDVSLGRRTKRSRSLSRCHQHICGIIARVARLREEVASMAIGEPIRPWMGHVLSRTIGPQSYGWLLR